MKLITFFVAVAILVLDCEGYGNRIDIPISTIYDRMSQQTLKEMPNELAKDHRFLMYTSAHCPMCRNTTKLLTSKYDYLAYDYYEYDTQPGGIWLLDEVVKQTNVYTLPHIFICQQYIGGYGSLQQLDEINQLEYKVRLC